MSEHRSTATRPQRRPAEILMAKGQPFTYREICETEPDTPAGEIKLLLFRWYSEGWVAKTGATVEPGHAARWALTAQGRAHLTDDVKPQGEQYTTKGGHALRYPASLRVRLDP